MFVIKGVILDDGDTAQLCTEKIDLVEKGNVTMLAQGVSKVEKRKRGSELYTQRKKNV